MSKYFSAEELACKCGCGGTTNNPYLLAGLDRIREAIGGPLYVSCAYRCQAHNDSIPGSVPNSQHVDGSAADVLQPDGMSFGEFKWYVEEYSGADGIGLYPYDGFIHIDYRENGQAPGKYRW